MLSMLRQHKTQTIPPAKQYFVVSMEQCCVHLCAFSIFSLSISLQYCVQTISICLVIFLDKKIALLGAHYWPNRNYLTTWAMEKGLFIQLFSLGYKLTRNSLPGTCKRHLLVHMLCLHNLRLFGKMSKS